MSEESIKPIKMEQLQLRLRETATGMKTQICYLLTLEVDAEEFFSRYPCKLCKSKSVKNHTLKAIQGQIWNVCGLTGISIGPIGLFGDYGEPYSWTKVVSEKLMSKGQVHKYLKAHKIVPEPQISMWLLR